MALKTLGQSYPSAATDTTLYTVPAATETVVSTIFACNRGAASALIRIAIRPAGAAISEKMYIYYDVGVPAYSTFAVTAGISLATTDVITVRTDVATVAFSAFGQEN